MKEGRYSMPSLFDPTAIAQGFWQGVFQLLALAIVAAFGTFVYQRRQARYALREELIESINQFAINLYKPRKLYQAIIDQTCDPLANLAHSSHREEQRLETIYRALDEVVAATGQFRVVQVKLIPLYGHDPKIFGYYMAIWRYLKEIRHRMGRSETLYFQAEGPDSTDAFYLLIDAFRYQIMVSPIVSRPPVLAKPSSEVLEKLRHRGDEIYAEFFTQPTVEQAGVPKTQNQAIARSSTLDRVGT
jgi:hypothetical protein